MDWIFVFLMLVATVTGQNDVDAILSEEFDGVSNEFLDMYYRLFVAEDETAYRARLSEYLQRIMNLTVDPCENFYEYACGNFENAVSGMDGNRQRYGSVAYRTDILYNVLAKLFAEPVDHQDKSHVVKVKEFYQSCVDKSSWSSNEIIEFVRSLGSWPLLDANWSPENFDWVNATAQAHLYGVDVNWILSTAADSTNLIRSSLSPTTMASLRQFFKFQNITTPAEYVKAVKQVFKRFNIDLTCKETMLRQLYPLQRALLARADYPGRKRRSRSTSRKLLLALQRSVPSVDFQKYYSIILDEDVVPRTYEVVTTKFAAVKDSIELVSQRTAEVQANHILLSIVLQFLNSGKQIGLKNKPKACVGLIVDSMTPAALSFFLERYYDVETANHLSTIVNHIFGSSIDMINSIQWLIPRTKLRAIAKLESIKPEVGFDRRLVKPEKLMEYALLEVDPHHFYRNLIHLNRYSMKERLASIGTTQWKSNPFELGASYRSEKLVLNVPLGRNQPPAFHKFNPQFMNYGSVGAIMGHELSHGFGPGGVKFDATGDKTMWYDRGAKDRYIAKMKCYEDQYDQYLMDNIDRTIDGHHTINENFADNQGMAVAVAAYKKWLSRRLVPETERGIDVNGVHLTNMQGLFVSFAHLWCSKTSDEALDNQIDFGRHSPSEIRVRGVVSNTLEFQEAYNCPIDAPMNPRTKCDHFH